MREPCCLWLSAADRAWLAALVADRNSRQKYVWRARIVLLSADQLGTVEIMRRTGKAKLSVWRWQAHLAQCGRGLLRQLTKRRLQRGVLHPLVDLQAAINRYLADQSKATKPFVWAAEPEAILAKVKRRHQTLETVQ